MIGAHGAHGVRTLRAGVQLRACDSSKPSTPSSADNSPASADSGAPLLQAACNQLPRWDNARIAGVLVPLPGLTKRRAAERTLCLQGST